MTNEQIRIKIAESLGWVKDDHYEDGFGGGKAQRLITGWKRNDGVFFRKLPNYPEDLNSCAEFEKKLFEIDTNTPEHESDDLVGNYGNYLFSILLKNTPNSRMWHATAPQRCKAYLRTLNLWTE